MADRLTDLILGLQRMAENARMRSDDLRYTQEQETYDHLQWLDQQLAMVEKVRAVLMEERGRFKPPQRRDAIPQDGGPMPRIVKQGPKEAAG